MRILVATQDFPPQEGGIQRYSQNLARSLQDIGVDVTVLAPRMEGASEHDPSEPYRTIRPRVSSVWALRLIAYLLTAFGLIVRDGIRSAVATNWYPLGLVLGLASRIMPVRFFIVCHGLDVLVWRDNPIFHRLMIWSLLQAECLICVSRPTKRAVVGEGIDSDTVLVFHPGLTPLEARELSEGHRQYRSRVMLTVCRLVKKKGVEDAIRSLRMIAGDYDLRYIIVGSGPELPHLEGLARSLGVSDKVDFVGNVSEQELADLYASSDVFVLPSKAGSDGTEVEGLPIVLLEAQMLGIPVVATRNGGIPEGVLDGKTGFLVSQGKPAEIAAAVRSLLGDREEAERMGRRASRWAGGFDWDAVGRRIVDQFSPE